MPEEPSCFVYTTCGPTMPEPGPVSASAGEGQVPQALETFVQRAAASRVPVLLAGEFGTEKAQVARALHDRSSWCSGPFIAIRCADPAGGPAQWCRLSTGGTLFLDGVDELPAALQVRLAQHLQPCVPGGAAGLPARRAQRVVAATTADLQQRVAQGRFARGLLAELDYLRATVPPLRERPGDIEPMLRAALARHGDAAACRHSPGLAAACRAHDWPENLAELDRVAACLVVMTGEAPVGLADLRRHVPWLLPDGGPEAGADARQGSAVRCGDDAGTPGRAAAPRPDHWVRCAMAGDPAALQALHPGVRKALLHLGRHYAEPMTLPQLAQQAHVSPSHLSYLLRSSLGATFKSLLQRIRVEKAREALTVAGHERITDVALSVGFGDLSHFEKSFRRWVGQSPREFRRAGAG
jgi:DNA-binding NtrC family response regulator